MITPLEIESKEFKGAFAGGYDKKEVDSFIKDMLKDYEKLYKENLEYKDKLGVLQDGISYYKSMEETLQKTLLLAEKTADETRSSARTVANQIEKDAELRAKEIIQAARLELTNIHKDTEILIQQYEIQRTQMKQILTTQLNFIEANSFPKNTLDNSETNQ
ncbi:MAG: DivIVA family protein [Clostridiales bacterium]|jgi:cell division initiation protein|nr:DivIVA family protein [Clostridiales bacterium]